MTKISNFWNWFKKNNKEYTSLNAVDEAVKGKLPDELLEQLHKYCDGLYFEIGGFPGEDQELIITAEGDRTYFDKVEELILAAPQMEGWTFVAFKPATNEHFNSTWGDIELNTEDMWFLPLTNDTDSELGIRVFLKNHESIKDNETLTPLLYKMLDTIVGEKVFALDIHQVDTDSLPENPEGEGLYPILELPEYIEWYKSNLTKDGRQYGVDQPYVLKRVN